MRMTRAAELIDPLLNTWLQLSDSDDNGFLVPTDVPVVGSVYP